MTSTTTISGQEYQKKAQLLFSACRHHHNHHQQKRSHTSMYAMMNFSLKYTLSGLVCLVLAVSLLLPPTANQLVEAGKVKKAVKSIAKGLIYQQLSTRKNFLPLPVPIPVPIEIEEDPVYLKGKPKYVNIYKQPKPTSAPVVKPTTVYHMPIYSPTYEYMSMDPMNSMYGAQMMYANPYGGGPSSYKSSVNTDSDSTSSVASANHGGASYGGINFNDYDDESGNYYMKKSAARRRKLMPGEYASSLNLHRIDTERQHALSQGENSYSSASPNHEGEMTGSLQNYGTRNLQMAMDMETAQPNDDESYDREDESVTRMTRRRDSTRQHGRRVKRQVYYESGYDGNTNCEGFPLEINVRSRIKLDRIFPIHGKSQIKKCVKMRKTLLPPPEEHY